LNHSLDLYKNTDLVPQFCCSFV